MTGTYQDPDYSLLGDEHVRQYQETDGRVGYDWNGAPTLVLTTTGRRSGQPRSSALIFGRDGDNYLIVASVGGGPEDPQWYRNLRADPKAHIQVRGEQIDVAARTATDDEKPRLWAIVNEVWPNYETYQSRTERIIPVVVLTPTSHG
jgi:deazaflavin-dependent oxidoreductase (nitroreductase family)